MKAATARQRTEVALWKIARGKAQVIMSSDIRKATESGRFSCMVEYGIDDRVKHVLEGEGYTVQGNEVIWEGAFV